MRKPQDSRLYVKRITSVFENAPGVLLDVLQANIVPHADAIADDFYRAMLDIDDSLPFLDNGLVNERLRFTMADWIRDLVRARTPQQVEAYVERQRIIGNVHARINIPMGLVNQGMSVIKRSMGDILVASGPPRDELAAAMMLLCELVDQSASLINESYVSDLIVNQRNGQALRLHVLSKDVALECEGNRASLFDWLRNTLTQLIQQPSPDSEACVESLMHSEVGLWVTHKAEMMFPQSEEVGKLLHLLQELDRQSRDMLTQGAVIDAATRSDGLRLLNQGVTDAAWLLSGLTEHSLKQEDGRDPLTRVLNRRYLPVIMQRETEISLRQQTPFCALMIDLDNFKEVNDEHGHPAGDQVLKDASEFLMQEVRTSDFVFRMGGEEFLVILVNTDAGHATTVAEQMRRGVEQHAFSIDGGAVLGLTVSIGVVQHDGHPDYTHLLKRADAALYESKSGGRNRVTCLEC